MRYRTTVTDTGGHPVPLAIVRADDEVTGLSISRGTDGSGFCDLNLGLIIPTGHQITLSVVAPGFKNSIQYPTVPVTDQDLALVLSSFKPPFTPAPRAWAGQMCGKRIKGLPPVAGGASDPALFLSWFYDRYPDTSKPTIRAEMLPKYPDWLLSIPDSRAAGQSPAQFAATCSELIRAGARPAVMLASKVYDEPNAASIMAGLGDWLHRLVGLVPRFGVAWEANLWLQPVELQKLIDAVWAIVGLQAGTQLFYHGGPGNSAWQPDGFTFADFWNRNVHQLAGVFHQKIPEQTREQYRGDSGGITDVLVRFAGGFNCTPDRGDGTPFVFWAGEIGAQQQFNGEMTEAAGDALGTWAIDTPPVTNRATVPVDGSGNGY